MILLVVLLLSVTILSAIFLVPAVRQWVGHRAGSVPYAVAVTLLLAVTGLLGSVYGNEIREAFPLDCLEVPVGCGPYGNDISHGAITFWSSLFLTGLLFGIRQWARDKDARDRTDELMKAIQTMPPAEFLNRFGDVYDDCEVAAHVALAAKPEDAHAALQLAIRIVLWGFVNLAKAFDDSKGRYAANIMIFVRSGDFTQELVEKLKEPERMPFRSAEEDVRAFRGVLDLRLDLSTSTEEDFIKQKFISWRWRRTKKPQYPRDGTLKPLTIPIPFERQSISDSGVRYRVLPGAPMAFCYRRVDGFRDTPEIDKWIEKKGALHTDVATRVKKYFATSETIRSFYCAPLMVQPDNTKEGLEAEDEADILEDPIGVLNLHSNRPDMLRGEALRHFVAVTRPLRIMLYRLTKRLTEVE